MPRAECFTTNRISGYCGAGGELVERNQHIVTVGDGVPVVYCAEHCVVCNRQAHFEHFDGAAVATLTTGEQPSLF